MKKIQLLTLVSLMMLSCVKQDSNEDHSGEWNGYEKYLKTGEIIHTLWAGRHINVGTVTYGLDENANFYVTYDCSASGWMISETHMFAGDKKDMPLNKPGAPKIGLFPNSGNHHPRVSAFTYRVPLVFLPPCASPGFVVASHCVVHSPAGASETAWAEGDYTFSDKGWGWYDDYFYNTLENAAIILYGTVLSLDSLKLYHIDITNNCAELILTEYVGNSSGKYDGAAYDHESGYFFFVNYNTRELWANQLTGEAPSFSAGTLNGTAASGTFYDGAFYYVDECLNTINKVTFTSNWTISNEVVLDTLPGQFTVNDIAMSPDGSILYLIGQYGGGGMELISWNVSSLTFYSNSIAVNEGAQIAFGSDEQLYAISPLFSMGDSSQVYIIETNPDSLTIIADAIIDIDDPLIDISRGPER
jgi:hypothetical protein